MSLSVRAAAFALVLVTLPRVASANTEPTANDARVVGIGGAAMAYLHNPASIYINPAGLAQLEGQFELTLSSSLLFVDAFAPIEGEDAENHTGYRPAPLPYFGLAARVHERVVVGLGVYIATGFGSEFPGITQVAYLEDNVARVQDFMMEVDQSVTFFEGEVALTVGAQLHDMVDLGFALRLPFAKQTASLVEEALPGSWTTVRQNVGGVGTPGILFGLTLHPLENLDLSVAYRSKVKIPMDGTIDTGPLSIGGLPPIDLMPIPTSTVFYIAHKVRAGFALHLLDDRLMIAGDAYIQLHKEANRSQIFVNEGLAALLPAFAELEAPFHWKNVYGGALGMEGSVSDHFLLRFGGSMSNSATTNRGAQYFTPPDSLLYSLSMGAGASYDRWDLDLGFQFSWGRGRIPVNTTYCQAGEPVKVGCPGAYGVTSIFFALSFTVRIGALRSHPDVGPEYPQEERLFEPDVRVDDPLPREI
jgi:long-subunit fatty acid transport protein